MPLYDYRCCACDHVFEKTVKMSEYMNVQTCPLCTTETAERTLGAYAPSIGDPIRLGITKPPESFRDLLRNIADKTPGGKMMRNNSSYI